jgi:hypothetical protein
MQKTVSPILLKLSSLSQWSKNSFLKEKDLHPVKHISQKDFIKGYFIQNPNKDIYHSQSKLEIEKSYFDKTNKRIEDSDRAIRSLHQEGFLIKVSKGVYRYDPELVHKRDDLFEFDNKTKNLILERDGYSCVICGLGRDNGIELQVDHILARQYGGKATCENGQTLCAAHNFKKNILGQTELGKKMFIRLLELAKINNDNDSEKIINFCKEVLEVFDKYEIDNHIKSYN